MAAALHLPIASGVPAHRSDCFDLLCASAVAHPGGGQVERVANWNYAEVEWRGFFGAADHHGVLALVARNLVGHGHGLPADVALSLRSAYEVNLRRNLWFAAELTRIVRHFAQNGVRVIPYKGPVLAQAAYGDLGLRSFSDLDLLISAVDFAGAVETLAEVGYRPSRQIDPAVERLWLWSGYERSFDGGAGKNLVELQWNFLPYFYAVDFRAGGFGFENLLRRSGRVAPGDSNHEHVPCLSAEDSLLALCLHGAKHLWTRLIWVADIAESLRMPGMDFAEVVTRARALGVTRILGVSVWLAGHLLGAAIPSGVGELIARDPAVRLLGEECAARLRAGETYDFESTGYFREIVKLRERAGDRWRLMWRLVWTPGPGDVAALALPEAMFPLYRAVRVGRLARRGVSGMLRGLS
jgi:hypothetical protein